MKRIAFVAATFFMTLPFNAFADRIFGQFDGSFGGALDILDPATGQLIEEQIIGSSKASIFFSYNLATAPDGVAASSSGRFYESGSQNSSELADPQWLEAAFDFGGFVGSLIPGTASWQQIWVRDDGQDDEFHFYITADWLTSFGIVRDETLSVPLFTSAENMFDSSRLPSSLDATGGGGGDRSRWSNPNFFLEFEFIAESLRIVEISEPSTITLLGAAFAGIGFARRRKKAI